MKKFALLVTSALLLSACKQAVTPATTSTSSTVVPSTTATNEDKITSAMTSGKPVSCSIAKKDGSSSMTYFAKGEKIKVTGISTQGSTANGQIISDGINFYSWDPVSKKGIKMQAPAGKVPSEANSQTNPFPTIQSEDDVKKFMDDGYTVECTNVALTDRDFVPPTDVEFTDMTAAARKVPANLPPQTQGEMEKQAQEMLKQYQQ